MTQDEIKQLQDENYRAMYLKMRDELAKLQQRTWVRLTDDEVYKIAFALEGEHWRKITDAIEAKLKEKNNG